MIWFASNNSRSISINQEHPNDNVIVRTFNDDSRVESKYNITAGDFVMLLNLYRYVKDNDIQNDFINPNGKNKEVL